MTTKLKRMDAYNREPFNYRKMNPKSETVPDQSMSLRTLLDRYARGIPMETKPSVFNEDEHGYAVVENYATLDLVDKQAIRDKIVSELDEIGQRVEKSRLDAKKKALKDELRLEMEAQNDNSEETKTE